MPSISDSQNIDLDPNGGGAPVVPPNSPLQVCPNCEAVLDISEREPLEKIACPQCGTEMLVKGQIAHYVITDVAGRGGMGVVYKAYDPSLDRHVAIKLLRKDQSADKKLIQQLETEAAMTASVNDPNVVRVFGTGEDRGRFYLVMELVDKGSLDNLIQLQGRVAEAQVLQIGIHAARGLRAAHQHGLIHRDVKPGNILFSDANTAKIVDFGLAVFQEQEESVRGEIWGTPYYVAPEKLDQQPEDFRSDMYSLGGTLFHALAGRPPFEAENASLVALKHLKSQQVSLQSFAPWVSNSTAHIVNRMLNKDPGQRFQSYDELIESLEYALAQLHARAGVGAERTRVKLENEEEQKHYTWIFLGLAATVLILGTVFGISQWKKKSAPPPKTVARAAIRTGPRYEPLQPAIEAFAAGQKEAVDLFSTASENPALSPADRTWAQLLAGAAMLANGKTNEARNLFNRIEESATGIRDTTLRDLLGGIASRVKEPRPVLTALTDRLDTTGHEAAAVLVYALHNWRTGKPDDAMKMFRQFRAAEPAGTAEWIGQLKPVAVSFIEKETAFSIALARVKSAVNPPERWSAADALRKIDSSFTKRADDALAPYKAELDNYRAEIARPPTSGVFRVISRMHGKALDVTNRNGAAGASVSVFDPGSALNQYWRVVSLGGDKVKFVAMHSGKVLAATGDGKAPDTKIIQTENSYDLTQQWRLIPKGDGHFKLRNEASGRILVVAGDKRDNNAPLTLGPDGEKGEWQWRFDRQAVAVGEFFGTAIGDPKRSNFEFKDGVFTIRNYGRDIWANSDHFAFAWQRVPNNFEIVARVVEVANAQPSTKVGIAIRAGLAGDDASVCMLAFSTPSGNPPVVTTNVVSHQQRLKKTAGMTETKTPNQKLPRWLKIVRNGTTMTTFHSADGTTWQQAGSAVLDGVVGPVFAGLAVCSHKEDKEVAAKIDQVKITSVK